MALINCPECGKQVSDKAVSCPNCGCPIATTPKSTVVRIKLPNTDQFATGWVAMFCSKKASDSFYHSHICVNVSEVMPSGRSSP